MATKTEKRGDGETHKFCVAPMMDWTDRHCRYFHRQMSRHALLYTEMVTADAAIHGDRDRLLGFDAAEHPVALQLGGSSPARLAEAARIGEGFGYTEINLNVGCPSDRVQSGAFGACLMLQPQLVADCVAAMADAVDIPVTVKCRIGVDDQDPEESLFGFVETVAKAGCGLFIVHARKAWLQGLSPKENREIPPLDYGLVRRVKQARPDLTIILNGGIGSVDEARGYLTDFDGVMLGRAAYHEPALLLSVDEALFGAPAQIRSREDVARLMADYVRRQAADGVKPHHVVRHMLGLFHGSPGARAWRRELSLDGARTDADAIERALAAMASSAAAAVG